MADYTKDELFNLILNSPEEYNEWKKTQEDEVDLSELDFSSVTLEQVDFKDADLNGSSFSDSTLTEVDFTNADLTAIDFTRSTIIECDFSEAILPGADFSYSKANYCNFTDSDMAGVVFQESDLENSDFSSSCNLNACRFDEDTVWPDSDMLPEDFDTRCSDDLSSLKDKDDDMGVSDY